MFGHAARVPAQHMPRFINGKYKYKKSCRDLIYEVLDDINHGNPCTIRHDREKLVRSGR